MEENINYCILSIALYGADKVDAVDSRTEIPAKF
jgi:hypothetical protein